MARPPWYHDALARSDQISGRQVFFVVGCQKSGTTWLARLLDGHDRVCCGGEGHFTDVLGLILEQGLKAYAEQIKTTVELDWTDTFAATRLLADQVLCRYLDAADDPARVTHVGDKTPEAALSMVQLDQMYPGARFVHVIRDGRDATVSGWAQLQRQGESNRFPSLADYAAYFARHHWQPYIRRARAAGERMPGRYHEIRYEAMIDDPVGRAGDLLRFLRLDDTPDDVAACVENGSFERLSGGRRPGQEDRDSHFRKGVTGDWKSQFDDAVQSSFEGEAGDLLRELGYAGAPIA